MSAIVLRPVLIRLDGLSKNINIIFGLFADNLVIGSDYNPSKFKNLILKIFRQNGFKLDDFNVMTLKDKKEIMGIIIDHGLKVKESYVKELRVTIGKMESESKMNSYQLKSLKGKINHIKQVNQIQANSILRYARQHGIPI
jgi:ribosomal protein S8